jgi:hypothetical protein
MKKTIEVTVSPNGDISIEGVGFKGPECEQATRFLEEALGTVHQRVKKPEHLQRNIAKSQQKVGG